MLQNNLSIQRVKMGYTATLFPTFQKGVCIICQEDEVTSQGYSCPYHTFHFRCLFETIKSTTQYFPVEKCRYARLKKDHRINGVIVNTTYSYAVEMKEQDQIRCPLGDYPPQNYFSAQVQDQYGLHAQSKVVLLGPDGRPKPYDLEPALLLHSAIQAAFSWLQTNPSFHSYVTKARVFFARMDGDARILVIKNALYYIDFICIIAQYKQLCDRIQTKYQIESKTLLKKAIYIGSIGLASILTFFVSATLFVWL